MPVPRVGRQQETATGSAGERSISPNMEKLPRHQNGKEMRVAERSEGAAYEQGGTELMEDRPEFTEDKRSEDGQAKDSAPPNSDPAPNIGIDDHATKLGLRLMILPVPIRPRGGPVFTLETCPELTLNVNHPASSVNASALHQMCHPCVERRETNVVG